MATVSFTKTVSLLWFCKAMDCDVSYYHLLTSTRFLSKYELYNISGLISRESLIQQNHGFLPMLLFLHYHNNYTMVSSVFVCLLGNLTMSGQKRPADCASSSSGGPPEKRREREGEDGGPGISTASGGSTAVETVIKLGGVSNSVRVSALLL